MNFTRLNQSVDVVSFDSDRISLVTIIAPTLVDMISLDQVLQLVEKFSFDSGKTSVIKLLLPKISAVDASDWIEKCTKILSKFSFGSDQVEAFETLKIACVSNGTISHEQVRKLLQTMQFDSDKLKVLKTLQSLSLTFTGNVNTTVDCFEGHNEIITVKSFFGESVSGTTDNSSATNCNRSVPSNTRKRPRSFTQENTAYSSVNRLSSSCAGLFVNGKKVNVTSTGSIQQINGKLFVGGEEYVLEDNVWIPLREAK